MSIVFYTDIMGLLRVTELYNVCNFLHLFYVCLLLEMCIVLFCVVKTPLVILICLAGVNLSLVLFLLCIYYSR